MSTLPLSRRAVTRAVLAAPAALIVAPAAGAPATPEHAKDDSHIIGAWARAIAASKAMDTDQTLALEDGDERGDQLWHAMEVERRSIMTATATTTRGLTIQLWAALWEHALDHADVQAIYAEDLTYMDDPAHDWQFDALFVIAALRSIKMMEA